MAHLLPYLVARHAAAELDAQGRRPGFVLTLLAGISAAATLGLGLIAAFFVLVGAGIIR